jgi:hypothetical protein
VPLLSHIHSVKKWKIRAVCDRTVGLMSDCSARAASIDQVAARETVQSLISDLQNKRPFAFEKEKAVFAQNFS